MPDPATEVQLTRKRADTRNRLLSAARRVFVTRGIRHASVEEICEAAGFTRGAFYSNFASKEELFLTLYRQEVDTLVERLTAHVEEVAGGPERGIATPADDIRRVVDLFVRGFPDDEQWFAVVSEFQVEAMRDPDLGLLVDDVQTTLYARFAEVLSTSTSRFGLEFVLPLEDVVTTIVAVYEANLRRSILAGRDRAESASDLHELLPRVVDVMIRRMSGNG